MYRRGYLRVLSGSSLLALAGCTGSEEPRNNNEAADREQSGNGNSGSSQRQTATREPTPTPRPDSDNDGVPDAEDDFPGNSRYDSDLDGDRVPDPEDDLPNNSRYHSESVKSGTVSIKEDHWRYWNIEKTSDYNALSVSYEFVVRGGPNVDVYVMSEREYQYFENGNRAKYFSSWSSENTGLAQTEINLQEDGMYVILVDNSDFGATQPPSNFDDDIVDVEYELTYRWS